MSRARLYTTVMLACGAGLIWLAFRYSQYSSGQMDDASACLVKQVTSIPCPSCGTTRSIFSLLEGNIMGAIQWNPFGIVVLVLMIISPLWIGYDIFFSKDTYAHYYQIAEKHIRTKWFAIPAITLVLANWIWNICKTL